MKHRIDAPCFHGAVHELGQFSDQNLQHTLQRCSDHMEGQEKDSRHNPGKTWQSRIFSGQHTVNFCAPHMLAALFWFYHGLTADFFNKIKTHIRNRRRAVQAALRLHLSSRASCSRISASPSASLLAANRTGISALAA